jgi:hypothetical protein
VQAALRRCLARLGAADPAAGGPGAGAADAVQEDEQAAVRRCVDGLLASATSVDNLSRMFEGWQAWL